MDLLADVAADTGAHCRRLSHRCTGSGCRVYVIFCTDWTLRCSNWDRTKTMSRTRARYNAYQLLQQGKVESSFLPLYHSIVLEADEPMRGRRNS